MSELYGDRYAIVRPLGRGALGQVYLVRDVTTGAEYALKWFQTESVSANARARFAREYRAMSTLDHPNVVRAHDWGEHEGRPFFTMDLVDGIDFRSWALSVRPVPGAEGYAEHARTVAFAMQQLADALVAVHAIGLIHCDLKPENVFVRPGPRPRVVLLDFGRAHEDPGDRQLSTTGAVIGSATYVPPEQAKGLEMTPAADLYGLGCLLFVALTGRPPFVGESVVEVLLAHASAPPPDPRSVDGRVPEALAALCVRLLAKEPFARPRSAREVAATLARYA